VAQHHTLETDMNAKTFTFNRTYTLLDGSEYGPAITVDIYRCDETGRFHVVTDKGDQVHSVMPWDCPADGGVWFAQRDGGAEIGKVSSGRSRSHVMRTLHTMRGEY